MSTADSLIIAISQLVTVECVWPFVQDEASHKIVWIGRATSLVSSVLATIMGLLWRTGVSALTAINFPIIIQAVPAYIFGLYATECGEIHPWSLTIGACKTKVDNHTEMLFVFDMCMILILFVSTTTSSSS